MSIVNQMPAYILAGGQSTRFGRDKSRALINGEPALLRLAGLIKPVISHTIIVSSIDQSYEHLNLPTIFDTRPNCGPLGGIEAAILHLTQSDPEEQKKTLHRENILNNSVKYLDAEAAGGEDSQNGKWFLLLSCDLVIVQIHWVEQLIANVSPDVEAVAFEGQNRCEPLLAIYSTSVLNAVQSRLNEGRRSMHGLLNEIKCKTIPLPDDWLPVSQFNTQQDFDNAIKNIKSEPCDDT